MQTGAQLTAGFLLTLPFQEQFEDLDRFQVGLYLALVLLAALTTALVMAPVGDPPPARAAPTSRTGWCTSAHRHRCYGVITCIALLITGMVMLIWDVVVDRTWAGIAAAAMSAVARGLAPRCSRAASPVSDGWSPRKRFAIEGPCSVAWDGCAISPSTTPGRPDHRSPGRFLWWMARGQWRHAGRGHVLRHRLDERPGRDARRDRPRDRPRHRREGHRRAGEVGAGAVR